MANVLNQKEASGPAEVVARPTPWIVGVGASGGGGVQDLQAFLSAWPRQTPAALMVVLHRNVTWPDGLRNVLSGVSHVPVIVAHAGDPVRTGVCYLGESAQHLAIDKDLRVDLVPDHIHQRYSIDLLLKSLARYAAPRTVAVVLSGSFDDSEEGAAEVRAAHGLVMTTADNSLTMAGHVHRRLGRVDFVGKPQAIAGEIARVVGRDLQNLA